MNRQTERTQAWLYRSVMATQCVEALIDEGRVLEPPQRAAGSTQKSRALDEFSGDVRANAKRMGDVYELLYCLENSMRELIERSLKEVLGPERWWEDGVDEGIRKEAEKREAADEATRWHGPRGTSILNFLDFPHLGQIILDRWEDFEDLLGDRRWVEGYFQEMNPTRRALAHTGDLTEYDVERMELRVREWLRVVG